MPAVYEQLALYKRGRLTAEHPVCSARVRSTRETRSNVCGWQTSTDIKLRRSVLINCVSHGESPLVVGRKHRHLAG
jgi:hypothetical protein